MPYIFSNLRSKVTHRNYLLGSNMRKSSLHFDLLVAILLEEQKCRRDSYNILRNNRSPLAFTIIVCSSSNKAQFPHKTRVRLNYFIIHKRGIMNNWKLSTISHWNWFARSIYDSYGIRLGKDFFNERQIERRWSTKSVE
jgi:hypothetical protein